MGVLTFERPSELLSSGLMLEGTGEPSVEILILARSLAIVAIVACDCDAAAIGLSLGQGFERRQCYGSMTYAWSGWTRTSPLGEGGSTTAMLCCVRKKSGWQKVKKILEGVLCDVQSCDGSAVKRCWDGNRSEQMGVSLSTRKCIDNETRRGYNLSYDLPLHV
jgi:hypothetical protein